MTDIIHIRTCDDPRDAVHRAVESLAAGALVGFPVDSSYVLAAQSTLPEAVRRLHDASEGFRSQEPVLALAVKGGDELLDFTPELSTVGERLARRLWPGPVVLEVPASNGAGTPGLFEALDPAVRRAVGWESGLRAWSPGGATWRSLQRLIASPLVLAEICAVGPTGKVPAATSEELLERAREDVRLVLDAGAIKNGGPCSIIRIEGDRWRLMQAGTLDETGIRERIPICIVFVCTGNTCRSPLAAAVLRKMLADRLGCDVGQLAENGYLVVSAGIAADYGMPAAAESLALAGEHGLDLASHRSQALTDVLLEGADWIYAMTASHRAAIIARRPELADRVELLSREGLDIVDPIGGGAGEYERCWAEIEREMLVIVDQLPIDPNTSR